MKQIQNPILPLYETIADGEPHVFGNRIYLFGSHDKAGGDTYCMQDYVFWSAPVDDPSDWSNKGVNYSAKQDPLFSDKLQYMYAPDVVQGNDGRFYLYYCLSGYKGNGGYGQPISVAVCDTPDGRYEHLGFVRNPDGSPMQTYITFDPAVLNDDGTIRLYYGTWYPFHERGRILDGVFHRVESRLFGKSLQQIVSYSEGIMGANHAELSDDMLTIKTAPRHILPNRVKGTDFEHHPFFEASSIRKIGDTYYFIYSSIHGHELCYATSRRPDRDFVYRGTVISNGDVGFNGRKPKDRLNTTGTNHGSIERINGQWYVFYHRNTNKTAYSRQACAEPITILPDGSIPQVEITSQGLNRVPLSTDRTYPAAICCHLTNGKMPHQGNGVIKKNVPYIAFVDGEPVVVATNGTRITYKYFAFIGREQALQLSLSSSGRGTLFVFSDDNEIGSATFTETNGTLRIPIRSIAGAHALTLYFRGTSPIRLKTFQFERIFEQEP